MVITIFSIHIVIQNIPCHANEDLPGSSIITGKTKIGLADMGNRNNKIERGGGNEREREIVCIYLHCA